MPDLETTNGIAEYIKTIGTRAGYALDVVLSNGAVYTAYAANAFGPFVRLQITPQAEHAEYIFINPRFILACRRSVRLIEQDAEPGDGASLAPPPSAPAAPDSPVSLPAADGVSTSAETHTAFIDGLLDEAADLFRAGEDDLARRLLLRMRA